MKLKLLSLMALFSLWSAASNVEAAPTPAFKASFCVINMWAIAAPSGFRVIDKVCLGRFARDSKLQFEMVLTDGAKSYFPVIDSTASADTVIYRALNPVNNTVFDVEVFLRRNGQWQLSSRFPEGLIEGRLPRGQSPLAPSTRAARSCAGLFSNT